MSGNRPIRPGFTWPGCIAACFACPKTGSDCCGLTFRGSQRVGCALSIGAACVASNDSVARCSCAFAAEPPPARALMLSKVGKYLCSSLLGEGPAGVARALKTDNDGHRQHRQWPNRRECDRGQQPKCPSSTRLGEFHRAQGEKHKRNRAVNK